MLAEIHVLQNQIQLLNKSHTKYISPSISFMHTLTCTLSFSLSLENGTLHTGLVVVEPQQNPLSRKWRISLVFFWLALPAHHPTAKSALICISKNSGTMQMDSEATETPDMTQDGVASDGREVEGGCGLGYWVPWVCSLTPAQAPYVILGQLFQVRCVGSR